MKRIVARRSGKPDRAATGEGPCPLHAPLINPLPPGSADGRGGLPVGAPACAQVRGANLRPLTITVAGARGGHGASTIAVAVALFAAGHAPTQLVTHDLLAAAALLGLGEPHGDVLPVTEHLSLTRDPDADHAARVHVHDAGTIGDDAHEGTVLAVLRGPCYLGLRALVAHQGQRADGIVVLAESGRSLERRDVEDVAGVSVVAVVPVAPTVARAIDAGLLVARLHRLREFTALRRYVTGLVAPARHPAVAASQPTTPVDAPDDVPRDTTCSPREPVSRIVTDLPVPLCGTG